MEENYGEHPADAILDATVDSIFNSATATDAVKALGILAGGIPEAFTNLVNNTSEKALRMTLVKILIDLHDEGEDEMVMDIMEFTSRVVLMYEPNALADWRQSFREDYDASLKEEGE